MLFVVHRNLLAYNFQLNLQIFTIYNNSKSQSTSCYTSNFLFCKVCYKSKNQRTICCTSQFANLKLSIKFLMYKDIKIKESSAVCYTLQLEIYNFIQPNLLIYKILLRVEFVAFLYWMYLSSFLMERRLLGVYHLYYSWCWSTFHDQLTLQWLRLSSHMQPNVQVYHLYHLWCRSTLHDQLTVQWLRLSSQLQRDVQVNHLYYSWYWWRSMIN